MRSLALTTVFIWAALSCFGQDNREPETFFKRSIGLSADQIAAIEQGKPVMGESEVWFETHVAHQSEGCLPRLGTVGAIHSVAIKQLYASHYFRTALDLSCAPKTAASLMTKAFI